MHRNRSLSVVLGGSSLAVIALILTVVGPAAAKLGTRTTAKITVVTVTAGKPSELAFKLSKFSALPAGTVTFNVKNMGLGSHDFKICTTPTATATKNACVGKVTKILKHGESATLTVVLTKKGKYEFLCDIPGHAAGGMKGQLGVGVAVTPSASAAGSTSSGSSTGSTSTGGSTGGVTTTTTTPAAGGGGAVSECPPGQTIAVNGGKDDDLDDTGGPTDLDGCL
jgi:uncharacterized cupredoxin-like copper-binding protein